jgi:uncharacterized membrane protein YkvI
MTLSHEHKTNILYALGAGLLLSDLIPTPADAVYFNYQRNNKQKLEEKTMTPKEYWIKDAIGYYGFNALWWSTVLGASYLIGKNYYQKRNLMIGLIAGGVVLSVLHKNIEKDNLLYNKPTQN